MREKQALIRRFVVEAGLALPPLGQRHFLSHLDEVTASALVKAFSLFKERKLGQGAHTLTLGSFDLAQTRLRGPKMGQESLKGEMRIMHSRGEGRAPEPVVVRARPLQPTDKITLIVFPDGEGALTLWTLYAGPAMPPVGRDLEGEWEHNALAFSRAEIQG
jgi:hypothetical protein